MEAFFRRIAGVILLLLSSCQPSSMSDFRDSGRKEVIALTEVLEAIQTPKQLQESLPVLQKHFDKLVDLMIEARTFYESHPDEEIPELSSQDQYASQRLKQELERLSRLDGGREMIEKAQTESLNKLHTFESRIRERKRALN